MMVRWTLGALGLLLASSTESPFSWSIVQGAQPSRPISVDERVLGVSSKPASISLVAFHDERPYGDVSDQSAWLVRYNHVRIPSPDGKTTADVSVSLMFRASTNQLVAAFTDAAPVWPKAGWTSADIAERVREFVELSPLESTTLQSSVVEVLRHAWELDDANPAVGGQITIRPRQFLTKATIMDANGNPLPKTRANGWVVEILGKQIGFNPGGGPRCTQVYVYRDGDLEFSGGMQI